MCIVETNLKLNHLIKRQHFLEIMKRVHEWLYWCGLVISYVVQHCCLTLVSLSNQKFTRAGKRDFLLIILEKYSCCYDNQEIPLSEIYYVLFLSRIL